MKKYSYIIENLMIDPEVVDFEITKRNESYIWLKVKYNKLFFKTKTVKVINDTKNKKSYN